jgi:hypothetical protein
MPHTKEPVSQPQPFWTEEDLISVYTRAQAIEDGVLVDVSEMAKEAGITIPVALTARVWHDDRSRPYGQSEEGRLWDILIMLRFRISLDRGSSQLLFTFLAIMKERQQRKILLKAMLGGGDNGKPVITIMFPEED